MQKYIGLKCSNCGKEYNPDEVIYTCPQDGGNLDIILDYQALRNKYDSLNWIDKDEPSLWRYLPLLPVNTPIGKNTPLWAAGWTPIYKPENLSQDLGIQNLWVKDESRNPTASFKDRASAVVVARAMQISTDIIVTASTGNAGAALAGMSAAVGQKAVIFAPRNAPPAKIAQLLVFGAKVLLVDGTYDDAFDLSVEAAKEFNWYCRNTGFNPFTAEGKKTAAYEIYEWMHREDVNPLVQENLSVFVSVGDGNIISGIHKGFKDLKELGWLPNMPRIFGIQSEGSAAISNAFNAGSEEIIPVSANTLADSISVDLPRDGIRAVRAATQSAGAYIQVTDQEILDAIAALGKVGIFAEPAGATSLAGVKKALELGLIQKDSPTLVINTGSGLKDVKAAMQAVTEAPIIEPSLDAVKKVL